MKFILYNKDDTRNNLMEDMMDTIKQLWITLRPYMSEEYDFQYADVEMTLESPQFAAGDKLADLWKMVAGVPGAQFTEEGLCAFDDEGALSLSETVEKDVTGFDKRVWRVKRETAGNVRFSYRFLPRDLTGVDRCHPYFDTIQEKNGALIPGVTSLAAVEEGKYHIHFIWDKSKMPEDADAAAIKGCGNLDYIGTPQDYTFSLYLTGKIKRVSDESGKRNIYWLDENLPDQEKVTRQLPTLLSAMCEFFGDEDLAYSVFFRKEPFSISNGGTAFDGGFVFGYSDTMPLIMEEALNTLAHEIVHNWPALDEPAGKGPWYSEGTAEFYSVMIPLRRGIAGSEQAAGWITEKCTNYYNNPYQSMTSEEAYEKAWEDNQVQRVPYGRGFIYLAETDYLLRKKSGGKRSLDDLVLLIVERRRAGEKVTVSDWEALIGEELGDEAVEHFRKVMAGDEVIAADDQWFDGGFSFEKGRYEDIKKGAIEGALIWRKKED